MKKLCFPQVRTTRLGVMGLAMNRFANLPFQSWELKPQGPNAVSLTLIAAVVVAEFTITVSSPDAFPLFEVSSP